MAWAGTVLGFYRGLREFDRWWLFILARIVLDGIEEKRWSTFGTP